MSIGSVSNSSTIGVALAAFVAGVCLSPGTARAEDAAPAATAAPVANAAAAPVANAAAAPVANAAPAADALQLLPVSIALTGPAASQRLVVDRMQAGRHVGQLTEGVSLTSSDEKVVRIEGGVALPVGNGTAEIVATSGTLRTSSDVTVVEMERPFVWSFRNHVESVLSKAGCNSGACHGAFAGKKGFKLSLRGFDAMSDYSNLTRQARARRVVLNDPGRSLLLTKPTGMIPHKGGIRFAADSPEYRVLAEWIAAGAPAPRPDDAHIVRLELLPEKSRQSPGAKQQLIVRAHFSDGHSEDVTRWAKFTSTNESVATVDNDGLVSVVGSGEAVASAWYLSLNVIGTLSVPYPAAIPSEVFAQAPRRNFIDELSLAKLESLNLPPSPPADDNEFIRRAYLDTMGLLPTADEVRSFVADAAPDKRDRLIELLLSRPEFVDYWTYRWCDLLLASGARLRSEALEAYYKWIRAQVEQNTPWDKFVEGVVTSSGSTLENGATNFYALHQDATEISETVSAAFLGMTINCARCHNHPLEKWTNDQYFAMANLFARVQGKGWGGGPGGDGNRTVFAGSEGDLIQPSKGRPQPPTPLDGQPLALDDPADRRVHLAHWLTAPENPYFTRAITNRVWANFFGVGLVEKVDDLRLTNPASNEELLAASAKYLADNHFDLKALMRAILQSATYQRSSQPTPENIQDERFYTRYYPKRLKAEVLIDALSQVTDVPTQFQIRTGGNVKDVRDLPLGKRAMQQVDIDANGYFFKSFGRPARQITCECERSSQPTMVQVLNISNGDTLNQKLEAKDNRIDKLLAAGASDEQVLEDVYLSALSRLPTPEEKSRLLATIAESNEPNHRLLLEDVYWGVLSSKEFLFNH
ncbi:MAG TPA: DUF1549 domain-containing protein [Pirellulales bacterium]|jgi:hypothetical protein|nr:DUF1549 domain-containing protein [Pirellulales bacterium]